MSPPSKKAFYYPAQTTAAHLFFSFFFSQAANPPQRQLWLSYERSHVLKTLSFTDECLIMTSLLLLISCWCGKPRPHPLHPSRGSRSLPRAGSSLTDSFLIWWGGGATWIGTLLRIEFSLVQSIPVTCTSIEAYKTPFQTNKGSLACRKERCPLASCLHCALSSFSV